MLTVSWSNAQQALSSNIDAVSVFPQGAEITRSLKADLKPGENVLLIDQLPQDLQVGSLRAAKAEGTDLRIDNQSFEVVTEREDTAEETALKDAIEALDQQLADLVEEQQVLKQRENFASRAALAYLEHFGNNETGGQNLEKAGEVLAFRESTHREVFEQSRKLDLEMKRLNDERREKDKELTELRVKLDRLRGQVSLRVFAAEEGTATLLVSYMVERASWYPAYNLRVDSEEGKMDLEYSAKISQSTGEDWDAVELSLHTQRPQLGGNAPVLNPVYLSPNYDYNSSGSFSRKVMSAPVMEAEMMADSVDGRGYKDKAQISQGFTSFSVSLPTTASLKNGVLEKQFPILQEEMKTEFWTEVVAPVSKEAFLKGKTENSLDLPLLPGQAQVFIDGNLNSRVHIAQTLPGEELELSLGRDPLILVERKLAVRKTEYSGIIDKTTTLIREYETQVTNFHPRTHRVKVKDHFPISQNEKIVVKPKDPDDLEVDEKTGEFVWDFELKSKKDKTLKTAFEVVHPRDWDLEDRI